MDSFLSKDLIEVEVFGKNRRTDPEVEVLEKQILVVTAHLIKRRSPHHHGRRANEIFFKDIFVNVT
jgi:hypothetical protein